jgi:hypothetical protein
MDLDFMYCMAGVTLLISSIYLSFVNKNTEIFSKFNKLLNDGQKKIYDKIVKERLMIYIGGMILGIIFGGVFYYNNRKTDYLFCKVVSIMILTKLAFYYFYPKRPLMLYSLTNKKQTDAWADIYTEMKSRWIKSLIVGIIGYIILGNVLCRN